MAGTPRQAGCAARTLASGRPVADLPLGPDCEIDTIHLGTCVKLAMETAQCPIDFDDLKPVLESKFGVQVVMGTHSY